MIRLHLSHTFSSSLMSFSCESGCIIGLISLICPLCPGQLVFSELQVEQIYLNMDVPSLRLLTPDEWGSPVFWSLT